MKKSFQKEIKKIQPKKIKFQQKLHFNFFISQKNKKKKIIKHESDKFKHDLWYFMKKPAALISFHSQP